MKRVALALMLALAAGLSAAPVRAQAAGDEPRFSVHGEVRTRWEYTENHSDLTDTTGGLFDDSYDFFPFRVRIGAKGVFARNVMGYVELQNVAVFGHQFTPEQVDQDPIGQTTQLNIDTTEVHMYQGFLEMNKIGDTAFGLRVGRQEHTIGNQLILGDLDFYGGQSFDGVRLWWDWEKFDLNAFYYRIGEENATFFGCTAGCGDENLDLYGVYATFGGETWGEIEPYIINFAVGDSPGEKYYSVGARWTRLVNDQVNSDKLLDWSFEYAIQAGSIDPNGADTDISADILEGWIGLNFGSERNHRVHVGVLMASGQDPASADSETWRTLGYDTWDHNRLGDADFFTPENIEDIFAGYTWTGENHGLRASYHVFSEAEAGVGGEDDLGTELDVAYRYIFNPNLNIETGVALLEPGDEFLPADDTVMRVWGQARLRF
jgi:hypothetical protein